MKLETFFDNFELLAEAPNGVQKLRELVLQLAISGKLVPQNLNDEPASELLKRVHATKRNSIAEKKLKKEELLASIPSNRVPYKTPNGWEWVRLGDISERIHYGYTASADPLSTVIRMLRITDIQDNQVNWSTVPGCQIDEIEFSKYELHQNDILIARTGGTIGKTFLVEDLPIKAVFASYLIRVVPSPLLSARFLKLFLESPFYWDQIRANSAGTGQPNVNGVALSNLKLTLPPIEEQHRIVAKVNQLMSLCDELEARQQKKRESRVRLNSAALDRFLAARAPGEFEQGWRRISDNFDILYDSPENVGALRQAILQLAVMGKLVEQDPNDEPASVLLEKIKAEKERLIKEKKIKKIEPMPLIEKGEFPYDLPNGWEWKRFYDVATIASNLVQPRSYLDMPHIAPDNIEKQTGRLLSYHTVREDNVRSGNHRFFSGQIIYSKIRPNLSKATIVDFDGLCSADMYPINAHINSEYLLKYMLSHTFLSMSVKNDTRVAMPKINQNELNKILVSVPPFEEQRRILAKVDQLMSLCDALEAKLARSQADGEKLMEAVVGRMLAGS